MLEGKKTYITLVVMALYNVVLPAVGIKDVTMDDLDKAVNTILIVLAGIFRYMATRKKTDG